MADEVDYGTSSEREYKEGLLRAEKGETDDAADEGRKLQVEGNETEDYIGTDPVYQNYSNDTEKPYPPGNEADKRVVDEFVAIQQATATDLTGAAVDEEDAQPATAGATAPPTGDDPRVAAARPAKSAPKASENK